MSEDTTAGPPRPEAPAQAGNNGTPLPDLTASEIFDAEDKGVIDFPIPEWGGMAYLRILPGDVRDALEARLQADKNGRRNTVGIRGRMAAVSLCDKGGQPLFKTNDIERLNGKNGVVLDRIMDKVIELNGMKEGAEVDAAKN